MPEPLDIEIQIYSRIWELLAGYAPWSGLVEERNRIRYDEVTGSESPVKPDTSDGDYPQVEMLPASSGSTTLQTYDPTFATFDDSATVHWNEKHSYAFPMILTSQLMGEREYSVLCTHTRNGIRKGRATLGLPYVSGVKLFWRTEKRKVTGDDDMVSVRFRTEMTVAVDCVVDSGDLLGS